MILRMIQISTRYLQCHIMQTFSTEHVSITVVHRISNTWTRISRQIKIITTKLLYLNVPLTDSPSSSLTNGLALANVYFLQVMPISKPTDSITGWIIPVWFISINPVSVSSSKVTPKKSDSSLSPYNSTPNSRNCIDKPWMSLTLFAQKIRSSTYTIHSTLYPTKRHG